MGAGVDGIVGIGEMIECYGGMGFIWWKREFEDKTVAGMGTVINAKGVVVVEVRNRDVIFGDGQDTRVMLPCLQEILVGTC